MNYDKITNTKFSVKLAAKRAAKSVTIALLLTHILTFNQSSLASEDIPGKNPDPSHVSVSCHGSQGSLEAKYADEGFSISFEKNGIRFERNFSKGRNTSDSIYSSAAYYSLGQPTRWLSISGSGQVKKWIEGHSINVCTRVDCHSQFVSAAYDFVLDEWVDLMLDRNEKGEFTFNRIEVRLSESPGLPELSNLKDTFYDLGAQTHCNVII